MKNAEKPMSFDPWAGCSPPRNESPDPNVPPLSWGQLRPTTRAHIGGCALEVLAQFPHMTKPGDIAFLAARLWERVRLDRAAEKDVTSILNSFVFKAVVKKLLAAGDVRASLLRRRAELDEALARVDATLGAQGAIGKGPAKRAVADHARLEADATNRGVR